MPRSGVTIGPYRFERLVFPWGPTRKRLLSRMAEPATCQVDRRTRSAHGHVRLLLYDMLALCVLLWTICTIRAARRLLRLRSASLPSGRVHQP